MPEVVHGTNTYFSHGQVLSKGTMAKKKKVRTCLNGRKQQARLICLLGSFEKLEKRHTKRRSVRGAASEAGPC